MRILCEEPVLSVSEVSGVRRSPPAGGQQAGPNATLQQMAGEKCGLIHDRVGLVAIEVDFDTDEQSVPRAINTAFIRDGEVNNTGQRYRCLQTATLRM